MFPLYETISDLPHHYETIPEATPHHYDYISNNIYTKGEPEDLAKCKWYHGKITRDQVDAALGIGNYDKFLVRHSSNNLILSTSKRGRKVHTIIQRSPKGYQLEGESKLFGNVPEMIAHYKQSLGMPVESVPSGNNILIASTDYNKILTISCRFATQASSS